VSVATVVIVAIVVVTASVVRQCRWPKARVRCRTALGARDGIAAKNLLGAILNEGGLARDAIGRIQVRDSFSLIELPEDGLEKLLSKLKDTRVAGKQLKLRRYRED
jgi:DbpA RNA binding domain.